MPASTSIGAGALALLRLLMACARGTQGSYVFIRLKLITQKRLAV